MEINKKELALHIMDLKIAKEIKENKEKNYDIAKEKIISLKNEKEEIYKDNEEIIEKALKQYLNEVKF